MLSTKNIDIVPKNPKSFLRWAGSKKKIVPILRKQMTAEFNKYIEPFVGSAQLYFASKPASAILSDTNEHLIECYLAVKKNPLRVYENLIQFPEGKDHYYAIRSMEIDKWDAEKKAARFIYLNTFCFNGLYRTNKAGIFNVPYSASSSSIPTLERLLEVSNSLQASEFYIGDFEEIVLATCSENDFVYLDPPYAVRNKDIFIQYGPETFGSSDLNRIKNLLTHINDKNATFLLSYAYCEESIELSRGWNSKIITTIRNISGFAKHRKRESEILISNKLLHE